MITIGIGLFIMVWVWVVSTTPRKLEGVEYNPLVDHTLSHIAARNKCVGTRCETTTPPGSYYIGMAQSHCYRCGKINRNARQGCKKWVAPYCC